MEAGRPNFTAPRAQLRVEVTSTALVAYNTRAHLVLTLEPPCLDVPVELLLLLPP